jgi:PTH1 family peptidyl-tRNA hydrolase
LVLHFLLYAFYYNSMAEIRLVVGLGNPGDEYVDTRHNIGFRVIDLLAEKLNISVKKRKFGARPVRNGSSRAVKLPGELSNGARLGGGEVADKKLILLKPWQFMNRSGQAVAKAVGFYKLGASDLLVITDCLALEPGRIRIRAKGSSGGHKGLADIIERLGTNEFGRLRIGIGGSGQEEACDYVLDKPSQKQKPLLDEAVERAREAVLCWVERGIEAAMSEFNN